MGNQTVDAREVNTQHPSNADAEIDLVEVFYLMWQNLWKIRLISELVMQTSWLLSSV